MYIVQIEYLYNFIFYQVVVHDQNEEVLMVNDGFVVPPASEALIQISRKEVCCFLRDLSTCTSIFCSFINVKIHHSSKSTKI